MADEKKSEQPKQTRSAHDDDVVGKVYDARLMRRLLTYLKPYKIQTGLAFLAVLIKAFSDVAGPFLVAVAVDTYMAPKPPEQLSWLPRHLSHYAISPARGITLIAGLYLAALLFTFLLELLQTYLMQWTGQKVMFDMRSQIFR